ncbi:tail fiber protein [Acinetobacter phage vB_AbaP_46-62_Aci07]|uniref:Putative capsular polysaccharide depolymerase n=1 Tax=Acinetobacter phage vB_AbaP_46-62_Aci07 TaxID=2315468 RepID=A0A386KKB8_9CAUD|nr:tail fiber protein [Acinetobacter phage vB_AbaP_46-62_Aci07]AYD85862.1 putative capsular polysaccharide depolymerase [Acinetobacter phage vB_AbaP_46-62_Aci07]
MNILRSFTETVVTTPTDLFPISFEYDEKYDAVHVFLNDVAVEDLGYTVSQVNAVTIKVEPAITEGTVRIERETDIDKMMYIFDAGALFIDQNVDADFKQIVHSQQEVRDGFIKLRSDVLPLVNGLREALKQAQEASEAAQEAADAAEEAAQVSRSAGQVIDESGLTQQDINNSVANELVTINTRLGYIVTPEQYGAKANDPTFDSTNAINNALASGSTIYADATKTYYVSGALVSKGQALIGGFKISSSKKIRPEFTSPIGVVNTTSREVPDPANIKFCFVQRSHDLVEFFKLRELGFNTILHYDLYNTGGTIQAVLDNARTAGLRVIVATENRSANVDTQVAFWANYDAHPALYAYSMFDEPVGRAISVATQDSKIAKYRAMTKKPLTVTEYYFTSLSTVPLSFNYDIHFIHGYARNWQEPDVSIKVSKDLALARKNTAYYTSVFASKKTIPVVGLFVSSTSDGMSNNVDQINQFATIYGQTNTGDLGVFIWDVMSTSIPDNLGNNLSFQETWKKCLNTRSPLKYKSICFGQGDSASYNMGISSILDTPLRTFDTSYAQNTNAYPVRIRTGAADSLFVTKAANATYAGIAFKTNNATYYSNIKISKFGTLYLWLTDITASFVGTINVYLSNDGGQTKQLVGTSTSTVVDLTFENPYSKEAILILEVISTSTASEYFRRFLRGVIMSSDW